MRPTINTDTMMLRWAVGDEAEAMAFMAAEGFALAPARGGVPDDKFRTAFGWERRVVYATKRRDALRCHNATPFAKRKGAPCEG